MSWKTGDPFLSYTNSDFLFCFQERLKKMEEKRREIEMFREWSRPRDDLECDDLKVNCFQLHLTHRPS